MLGKTEAINLPNAIFIGNVLLNILLKLLMPVMLKETLVKPLMVRNNIIKLYLQEQAAGF